MCDYPTPARKVQFKDDLSPSSAPNGEPKDKICDEIIASFARNIAPADSVCDDLDLNLAPKAESGDAGGDDHDQSFAPTFEQNKETCVDDVPIPAQVAPRTEDKKKLWSPCANPGNPIFSCMAEVPTTSYSPVPFVKPQNPLYKTTSADYGSNPPTCDIAPSVYYPLTQSFSAIMQAGGMYRNRSMNTGLDKNRVHEFLQY